MALIRIGFFEDFKGADTLLLDVDQEGLKVLTAWLQTATSSGQGLRSATAPEPLFNPGFTSICPVRLTTEAS